MKTFILLTFGFLAVVFYQMSGGADFQPASVRMAAIQPAEPEVEVAEPVVTTQAPVQDTVTRVSLNLTSVQPATTPVNQADADAQLQHAIELAMVDETQTDSVSPKGAVLSSADTPAIIPSLIAPAGSTFAATRPSAALVDTREVSASRVNVRGGPGTEFGVVTKLVRGDMVEIIEDNGEGWVRMRPLSGGPEGWMADFLLTGG